MHKKAPLAARQFQSLIEVYYNMHWFKRNIGDYHKKAGRLTMLQHGAYTLLMDSCYDREQFPTKEEAIEWVWASTPEEIHAVEFVLGRFFNLENGVYIQHRIAEEIEDYQAKAENNKRIALEREANRRKKRTKEHEPCTDGKQDVYEAPPNQEPRTKNQEPVLKDTVPPEAKPSIDDEFELFWQHGTHSERPHQLGLKKTNKTAAKRSFKAQFNKLPKDFKYSNGEDEFDGAKAFAMMLVDDIGKRCNSGQFGFENSLHPTTYLNNQRWNDEYETRNHSAGVNQIGSNFDKPEGWS